MKKTYLILTIFFAVLALIQTVRAAEFILDPAKPTTTSSSETVFTRNLTVGSYGTDVMALKQILGLELSTSVDASPTFTADTAAKVKAVQEKYPVDILLPEGRTTGTGSVDGLTLQKLNILATKYAIALSNFTLPAVQDGAFTRTLSLGSVGDDVALLKNILNSDPATVLSPKNFTNTYDAATAAAVKRFQEKYASEILTPFGLTVGTGSVGNATLKKLNAIVKSFISSTQPSTGSGSSATTPGSFLDKYANYDFTQAVTSSTESSTKNPIQPKTTCTEDLWTYGPWGACNASGISTRSATISFNCPGVYNGPKEYLFQPCNSVTGKLSGVSTSRSQDNSTAFGSAIRSVIDPFGVSRLDPTGITKKMGDAVVGVVDSVVHTVQNIDWNPTHICWWNC